MLLHAVVLMLQAATNADLGFVRSLPDGFVPTPAEFAGARDVVGCWAGEGSQSSQGSFVLCVQRMQATLGREHLKSSDLPASSQLLTVKWQGLDIDAIRTDTSQAGAPLTVYTAQVPLRREAIQVVVAGPRGRDPPGPPQTHPVLAPLLRATNSPSPSPPAGGLCSHRCGRAAAV